MSINIADLVYDGADEVVSQFRFARVAEQVLEEPRGRGSSGEDIRRSCDFGADVKDDRIQK